MKAALLCESQRTVDTVGNKSLSCIEKDTSNVVKPLRSVNITVGCRAQIYSPNWAMLEAVGQRPFGMPY